MSSCLTAGATAVAHYNKTTSHTQPARLCLQYVSMPMAIEADHGRRPAGKQRNSRGVCMWSHNHHRNKRMRCIHGWTSTVLPRLALLDSGCGVALLDSGCGVALLDSGFGLALLDMVLSPCSATAPATARSADLQRPVLTKRTF